MIRLDKIERSRKRSCENLFLRRDRILDGEPDWARNEPIQGYPSRVPGFHGGTANGALEARVLPRLRHVFGAAVDRPARARPVMRQSHARSMRPESELGHPNRDA